MCVCVCALCAEAKQQTSLIEWCEVKVGVSPPECRKNRQSASVPQEADLLDSGGDSVFSQMVNVLQEVQFFWDDCA